MAIQRKCYNSSTCGSGYACIGNECVPQFGASGMAAGQASGCGAGSTNGGTGGCSEPGCSGGVDDDGDGGGGGGGTPPGPDPGPNGDPGGNCNGWCDSYNKANGVPGPGCGPNSGCPECYRCNNLGTAVGTCSQAVTSCKCPGGTCPDCQACGEDGVCTDASDLCETCCEATVPCPCERTAVCRICGPVGSLGPFDCLKCAQSKCNEDCPPPPDPPGPEPCDCNCHDDCGECEICNAAGECEPDPLCDRGRTTWTLSIPSYIVCGFEAPPSCEAGGCEVVSPQEQTHVSGCGKLPHSLRQTTECAWVQGTSVTDYGCTQLTTNPAHGAVNQPSGWQVVDADGNVVLTFNGNYPNGWGGGAHPDSTSPGCVDPVLTAVSTC